MSLIEAILSHGKLSRIQENVELKKRSCLAHNVIFKESTKEMGLGDLWYTCRLDRTRYGCTEGLLTCYR